MNPHKRLWFLIPILLLVLLFAFFYKKETVTPAKEQTKTLLKQNLTEKDISLVGEYQTFSEDPEAYWQSLSISHLSGNQYKVDFSASLVKDRPGCSFEGVAALKDGILTVDLPWKEHTKPIMEIKKTDDGLGLDVFTKKFENRFAMMFYCGGASLAGEYLKKNITQKSIGAITNNMTLRDILALIPEKQVLKTKGFGEFAEDVYNDYQIINKSGKHLFTLTLKDTRKGKQINRVLVASPFFKTEKGVHKNSNYGDIEQAYSISRIEPTREHIAVFVDEIGAQFNIPKKSLKENWWDDANKRVRGEAIPKDAKVSHFLLWWNK